MSLLSYNRLCELVEQGVIEGVQHKDINAGSIDIHLGDEVLFEGYPDSIREGEVDFSKREGLAFVKADLRNCAHVLLPNEFCLAHSREVFNLPNNICAEYKLKSSMARIGLEHMNAGWCDAGWNGSVLTLEFKNMTRFHSHRLVAGMPIGQIVFFECEPVPNDRSYAARGRYNGDKSVASIKE